MVTLESAVAIEWAQAEPAAAADYVAARMTANDAQLTAARTVAIRWATLDYEAAHAWVAAFPDVALREELLKSIAGHGAGADRRFPVILHRTEFFEPGGVFVGTLEEFIAEPADGCF